ncbi:hypothetical protein N7451_012236 [Penicillium sp. IBT 35674x]|nr:hypothetical protein N7451_012236 [Penicillium sp. IBT 35674x]
MALTAGKKQLALCLDATGYRFHGDESDSNVLRIFRMLDDDAIFQHSYYQPGFGTYESSTWLSQNPGKLKSRYLRVKDAVTGAAYPQHVMAAYRWLMRHYSPGDSIYMFGCSRGAFVARILAEMLDHVGLLRSGNDDLVRFAWKTFAYWKKSCTQWHSRPGKRNEQFNHMKSFRETFCRPVPQIRFLGLFDLVNSVPRVEIRRVKLQYPFMRRTSAKVIRHALSIDERRSRFRNELVSDLRPRTAPAQSRWRKQFPRRVGRPRHENGQQHSPMSNEEAPGPVNGHLQPVRQGAWGSDAFYRVNRSLAEYDVTVDHSLGDTNDLAHGETEMDTQDVEEVWFPGCHMDIGGGMNVGKNENWPLSHVPLVWIVQEAQRAGLRFDLEKLKQFNCVEDSAFQTGDAAEYDYCSGGGIERRENNDADAYCETRFMHALRSASTQGQIHDGLQYNNGTPQIEVLAWTILEYLPIRRMLLEQDEVWNAVRWPLPRGEARSIPADANIHGSAIRRMQAKPTYRPANLIEGKLRKKLRPGCEIGKWEVYKHRGIQCARHTVASLSSRKLADDGEYFTNVWVPTRIISSGWTDDIFRL